MGFKYTHRVYNDVQGTTPTEQQVLALLAHIADDRTGTCFPSIETLARQSHLHRVTVMRALNGLKERGLLKWISGGRKKKGRVLSNLYKLELPEPLPKTHDPDTEQYWSDHKPPVAYKKSPIDHPEDLHVMTADGDVPGRFDLGVARRTGILDEALKKIEDAGKEVKRRTTVSLVEMAMSAAETSSLEDNRTFQRIMMHRDSENCRETIYQFDSEKRAGEFRKIKNLPALLTKRLSLLPATTQG